MRAMRLTDLLFILAALKFLVGNKTDLERLIPAESIDNFSAAFECEYTYLVSAKTGKLSTVNQTNTVWQGAPVLK